MYLLNWLFHLHSYWSAQSAFKVHNRGQFVGFWSHFTIFQPVEDEINIRNCLFQSHSIAVIEITSEVINDPFDYSDTMQWYPLATTYLLHLWFPIPLLPIMHLVQIHHNTPLVSFIHATAKSFATKMCILVCNICRWCKTMSLVKYLNLAQNFSNCQIFSLMANYFHCWILSVGKLLCIVKYSRILFANSWQGVDKNHKQKEELKKEDCIQQNTVFVWP